MDAADPILGLHHRCGVDSTIHHTQGPGALCTGEAVEGTTHTITPDHVLIHRPGGVGHFHQSDNENSMTGTGR